MWVFLEGCMFTELCFMFFTDKIFVVGFLSCGTAIICFLFVRILAVTDLTSSLKPLDLDSRLLQMSQAVLGMFFKIQRSLVTCFFKLLRLFLKYVCRNICSPHFNAVSLCLLVKKAACHLDCRQYSTCQHTNTNRRSRFPFSAPFLQLNTATLLQVSLSTPLNKKLL